MQRGQFELDFIELTKPSKIACAFGAQAVGFKRGSRALYAIFQAQQQAGWLHVVKRRSASLYVFAVCSMTAAGNSGAGACLFHGLPSTRALSSQSRRNCLS